MPLTREQALQQLQAWTKSPSLLTHARSVETVMRAAAAKYGGDPGVWAVTGLLHDADYDQWPEDHPKRIVDWLRAQGEEEIAYAVSFHQTAWDLPPKTMMDKGLQCGNGCYPSYRSARGTYRPGSRLMANASFVFDNSLR